MLAQELGKQQYPNVLTLIESNVASALWKRCMHAAVFNEEYIQWMADNIKPMQYEIFRSAFESRWDSVMSGAREGRPEVVLVTQSTVSRCAPCMHPHSCSALSGQQ
jgi:hypothetical protein